MATRRVATVFGGSGFIGRYVVKRLAQRGFVVRVAVRDPEAALFLKPMGAVGQIVPLYASVMNEGTVHRAIAGAEVVVNLVGVLAETRGGLVPGSAHRGRRTDRPHLRSLGRPPAGPRLRHRRRSRQPEPVRRDKGQLGTGGAGGFPGGDHPATLDRVRRGGQILQSLCRDRPDRAVHAGYLGSDENAAGVRRRCRGRGHRRIG